MALPPPVAPELSTGPFGSWVSFQVAKFVYECMEFRRSEECEDYNPYFDLSLFGDEWQGRIFDTFSSGPGRSKLAATTCKSVCLVYPSSGQYSLGPGPSRMALISPLSVVMFSIYVDANGVV